MSDLFIKDMDAAGLSVYVARQLEFHFPDGKSWEADIKGFMPAALERTYRCFQGIERKKYRFGGRVMFNPLHPDHYAAFLYLLANTVSRTEPDHPLAFRLFYLNKVLHGLDAYPDVQLPEVFQFMHPLGTVLGHARYGNYFCAYQGCSVGSDEDGVFPTLGDYVILYAGASVIGRCNVGSNVVVGAGAMVLNRDIPDDKVVVVGERSVRVSASNLHVRERRFT